MISAMGYTLLLFVFGCACGWLLALGWMRRRARVSILDVNEELDRYRRSQMFANMGVWDWSVKNDVLYWSDEVYAMFGYEPGEVTPTYQFFIDAVHPDDKARVQAAEDACLENLTSHDITYRVVWPDGTIKWLHETGDVLFDDEGEAIKFTGVLWDVTVDKEQHDEILHLAHYDGLTGLPNRELFRDHLKDAIARAERHGSMVALVFMDLNKFKPINDTFGHRLGDQVLIQVGQRLKGSIRSIDSVARIGGDEFVVTLEDINTEQEARGVAEKLRAVFDEDFAVEDYFFDVGVSIGISLYPEDAQDLDRLIHIADMAMYREKNSRYAGQLR